MNENNLPPLTIKDMDWVNETPEWQRLERRRIIQKAIVWGLIGLFVVGFWCSVATLFGSMVGWW